MPDRPTPSPLATRPSASSRDFRGRGAPEHPYLDGQRLRAHAYLDLARTAANYRLLAVLLLAANLALTAGLLAQSQRTRITPYVVDVDRHGHAVAFRPADRLADPGRALRVHEVSRWVRHVRTVTTDRAVQRHLVLTAYAYTGGRAVTLLNDWYRAEPPFARAERGTVEVEVTSVLALPEGRDGWQVQWTETRRDRHGTRAATERWQALVTLDLDPPERVEEVLTNPLGLRVVDFDWTRLPDPTDPEGAPR